MKKFFKYKQWPVGWFDLFSIIIISPKPSGLSYEAWYVAAVGVLIAVLWASEAIPLFVTALFPLVFFPLLGISTFAETAIPYANKNIFLFLGGFILAQYQKIKST